MSTSKIEFNLQKLQEISQLRWLKTMEVYQILKSIDDSNLGRFITDKLPNRPQNGSLFIIDASKANKKWKQDGYSYVKRNNGVGFREDVIYLKIGGIKEIMCSYSHLDCSLIDQAQSPFCRRIYKLVNKQGDSQFFLIHYFNDKTGPDSQCDRITEATKDLFQPETPHSNLSTSDEISKSDGKGDSLFSPSHNLGDIIDRNTEDENLEFICDDKLDFIDYGDNILPQDLGSPQRASSNLMQAEERKSENFQTTNGILIMDNRIIEIENRLNNLEIQSTKLEEMTTFQIFNPNMIFDLIDFSPEWDYTKGGAKVLLCVNPLCQISDALNGRIKVTFGDIIVPGIFIQPGVVRCHAPPHPEGFVKLSLSIDGQKITKSGNHLFEFRKNKQKFKPERESNKLEILEKDAKKGSEFKVRIVDKMREHTNMFGNVPSEGNNNFNTFMKYYSMDVSTIENLKEFMPENDLLEILQYMSLSKSQGEKYKEFINKLNPDGYAMIHYLCFLEYANCLIFLLKEEALPNIASTSGFYPIEIAVVLKNEKILDHLLVNGAINPKQIDNRLTEKLIQTSLCKDAKFLDMILREVSLVDSLSNAAAEDFDDEDPQNSSYFSLPELLEQIEKASQSHDSSNRQPAAALAGRKREKPRRYHKRYERKPGEQAQPHGSKNSAGVQENQVPETFADHENQIQMIQKNVRMWLLRRQYQDILQATRVLQHHLRSKLAKKKFSEESLTELISSKVTDWLKIKKL